jgi:hypothetical protein
MYKIIVKGEASTDYSDLKELDGIDCQDEFSEYFDDDFTFKNDVSHGYMDFRVENGKLFTYTTYQSNRLLTKEELDQLQDYTQGQWSDGIGEGFEQNECKYDDNDEGIFISPWFPAQEISITQEEVK